ncbi:MAG: hypothetical protein U9R08_03415 [Nanoarchaeota archaeon]|nr:hypothetical protein [Nanoarchaeota archaeon]
MAKETSKIAIAASAIGVVSLALGGMGGYMIGQNGLTEQDLQLAYAQGASDGISSVEPITITETVEVPIEVIREIEVPVETIVEVPVQDNTLQDFLTYLEDKDLIDDADEAIEAMVAETAAIAEAVILIEEDIADALEDEDIVKDEDDVVILKIKDDLEDVEIVRSDFDDDEYKFRILLKVEDERKDKKFYVEATIEVEDGEAVFKKVEKV